ncbi:hypothetical protein [Aeromonas rivuli]|uniref:hypothetical protein n=1 Tax=Aeromonas rivuli TaxID=648794 RepID=UPI001CCE7491|nr:hypothetical protein [Aeromonas rivuli]UBO75038.1 hypothetical protein KYK33_05670 [Aeromonas rivuli]
MLEVWDEQGYHSGLSLEQLQIHISRYSGELMVRYRNRIGLSSTLFLTVRDGQPLQRFKQNSPPLDWHWLSQALHPQAPSMRPTTLVVSPPQ